MTKYTPITNAELATRTRQVSIEAMMSLHACIVIIWLGVILPGCAEKDNGETTGTTSDATVSALAKREADHLSTFQPQDIILSTYEAREIQAYVRSQFSSGNIDALSALINIDGPWKDKLWYSEVQEGYARGFSKPHPVKLSSPDKSLQALRILCGQECGRQTRVYAAEALQFEAPELARRVLLEEYANVKVDSFPSINVEIPLSCAYTLRQLGVKLPDEITYLYGAMRILRRAGMDSDNIDRRRAAAAATAYNAMLRRFSASGRDSDLPNLKELYDKARPEDEPTTQESLFQ